MVAADDRLVADVADWLFGDVLPDVRSKSAYQRSSWFRPVIWRSVVELMAGMLWQMACYGELLRNQLFMQANWLFPSLLMQFGDICHYKAASGNSQRRILCP